jgi:hypothetical protein
MSTARNLEKIPPCFEKANGELNAILPVTRFVEGTGIAFNLAHNVLIGPGPASFTTGYQGDVIDAVNVIRRFCLLLFR